MSSSMSVETSLMNLFQQTSETAPYEYAIPRAEGLGQFQCWFRVLAHPTQEHNAFRCEINIKSMTTEKKVANTFDLICWKTNRAIMYCDKLHNSKMLNPPICIPCEFSTRMGVWIIRSSFNNIRSLFSLNTFNDGYGTMAMLFSNEIIIHLSSREFTLKCMGLGGYILNQSQVCEFSDAPSTRFKADEVAIDMSGASSFMAGLAAASAPTRNPRPTTSSSQEEPVPCAEEEVDTGSEHKIMFATPASAHFAPQQQTSIPIQSSRAQLVPAPSNSYFTASQTQKAGVPQPKGNSSLGSK